MQLKFTRGQREKQGFFGTKTLHTLEVLLEFSPEEKEAISKHKIKFWNLQYLALEGQVDQHDQFSFQAARHERMQLPYAFIGHLSTNALTQGVVLEDDDIRTIIAYEEAITQGLRYLKALLEAEMSAAGGSERVVEI